MYRAFTYSLAVAAVSALGTSASAADLAARQSATMAQQGFNNSAAFNSGIGMPAGGENQAASGRIRDANHNLMIVNGIIGGAGASATAGASASANASVNVQEGVSQFDSGSGSATAIGNSLNVNVIGNWNTTIVDSTQINNGNQNADVSLNGKLKL
jgi:holdfast attachment protein HfaA